MAANNIEKLNSLPQDVGGRIKELSNYDFMDEQARQQFHDLIEMLKQHATQQYTRELTEQLKNMDSSQMANLRNLVEAINQMLEQRLRGEEPDFEKFMQQYGQFFGPNPPQNLDELIEQMQQQMAQAQSLLESISAEDRTELENLLQSMLDEATLQEIAAKTDGRYFRAEDTADLAEIYDEINALEQSQIEFESYTRYRELAALLLIPALLILLAELLLRKTVLRRLP